MGPMGPGPLWAPWAHGPWAQKVIFGIWIIIKSRIPIFGTFLAIGDTNGPRDHSHQNRIEKLV